MDRRSWAQMPTAARCVRPALVRPLRLSSQQPTTWILAGQCRLLWPRSQTSRRCSWPGCIRSYKCLPYSPSGQVAYVGHIVNLRQEAAQWVRSLPVRPEDIPIVLVRRRTREPARVQRQRPPFAARKSVLRAALTWLLENHPQWQTDVHGGGQLSEANLDCYTEDGAVEVPTQEVDSELPADVAREVFVDWIMNPSFRCAGALRRVLSMPSDAHGHELWDAFRKELAEASGNQRLRAAETIPLSLVGAYLAEHDKFEMRQDGGIEPTDDEALLGAEVVAIMEAHGAEMPVIDSGTI